MKKNKLILVFSVFILLTLLAIYPKEILILHTNDFHGHLLPFKDKKLSTTSKIGGSAYIATIINQERLKYKYNIIVSAGDIAQGTPISNLFYGKDVIEVMNKIGYSLMTIGNHEFDWGQQKLIKNIKLAKFDVLSCNVLHKKDATFIKNVKPYEIKEFGNTKIAFIGVTTPTTPKISLPKNMKGLIFVNAEKSVKYYINIAKKSGADIIIVLSHLGFRDDKKLAKDVKGIDIIIGGHSHTILKKPIKIGDTKIVQAGSYGKFVGKLVLKVNDKTNKLEKIYYKLIPVIDKNYKPYFEIQSIVDKYEKKIEKITNKIIGKTKVDLIRNYYKESNIGDLITDAVRQYTKSDIAFQNSGGIRSDIYKGNITKGDIFTVLPFGNNVVVMQLTGKQIKELLEKSVSFKKGFLQVSGLKFVYNTKNEIGNRVEKILINGKEIDLNKNYIVATNYFLSKGGDGFTEFAKGKILKIDKKLRDIVEEYIQNHSPIDIKIDGRIKRISK